jgi:hypothetical protein
LIFKSIPIAKLIVNPENDRHGPTASEDTAISWLFENKAREMKKLASRIAGDGRVFDSPLVVPNKDRFLVKDGNRRVTCIKLIHDPARSPEKFRNFFSDLQKSCEGRLPKSVTCQIENDFSTADEIIGLRHNGTQGGVGQLMWGTREKANHANRTSGQSDYEWPQLVEKYLEENGHSDEAAAIKRSTLERVLKAKKRRKILGIGRDEDGNLVSTIPGHEILPLLVRFANDIRDNKLTLKETLVSRDLDEYLAKLQSFGLFPGAKRSSTPSPSPSPSPNPSPSPKPSPNPRSPKKNLRNSLIPRHVFYEFDWTQGQTKIEMAWAQLQHELDLETHKFSIAVVLRTLLEMISKNFRDRNQLPDKQTLAKNLKLILSELEKRDLLEAKTVTDVKKVLENSSSTISVENLQRVVHSTSQIPSQDDLTSMWDCLEPFLVTTIKSVQVRS